MLTDITLITLNLVEIVAEKLAEKQVMRRRRIGTNIIYNKNRYKVDMRI